jgi:hypothetical protein
MAKNYNSQTYSHVMLSIYLFFILLMCNLLLFPFQYSQSSLPIDTIKDNIPSYIANSESEQASQSNNCIDDTLCNNFAINKQLGTSKTITDDQMRANLSIIQSNECSDNQICVNDARILDHPFLSKESQTIIQHCDASSGPTCVNINPLRVDTDALSKAMLEYSEEEDSEKNK